MKGSYEFTQSQEWGLVLEMRIHGDISKMSSEKYDVLNGNIDDHICDLIPYINRALFYASENRPEWWISEKYIDWLKRNKHYILSLFHDYIYKFKCQTGYDPGFYSYMETIVKQIIDLYNEGKI